MPREPRTPWEITCESNWITYLYVVEVEQLSMPQAYDQHLNMILGEVEETVTTNDVDEETSEEIIKVRASVFT